jgi:hypothetical protein
VCITKYAHLYKLSNGGNSVKQLIMWAGTKVWFPCGRQRTLFILGSLGQWSRSPLLWIEFLTTGSFPHDNFSSVRPRLKMGVKKGISCITSAKFFRFNYMIALYMIDWLLNVQRPVFQPWIFDNRVVSAR